MIDVKLYTGGYHSSEFVYHKYFTVFAYSWLFENHLTHTVVCDKQGDNSEKRRQ